MAPDIEPREFELRKSAILIAACVIGWVLVLLTGFLGFHMWMASHGKTYEPPQLFTDICTTAIGSAVFCLGAGGAYYLKRISRKR